MAEEIDLEWIEEREKVVEQWDRIETTGPKMLEITKVSLTSNTSSAYDSQPSCSFQGIWSKLTSEDLSEEKVVASDLIAKAEAATSNSNRRIPYCICRLSRPTKCNLLNGSLSEERLTIVALTKMKYSESNPAHWDMLVAIYKYLINEKTNKTEVPRIGKHWETIGFQGDDPATDLRGVGIFGLCQLLFLVSNGLSTQMVTKLVELSRDNVQNFPLAVVGLTWTQIIVERLKKGKLNNLAIKENSFISVVNGVYRGCFIVFHTLWRAQRCTIADFCKISDEIKRMVKRRPKYLLNMAVLNKA